MSASPAFLLLALVALGACSSRVHTTLPVEWRRSPSFGDRRPNLVVIHHTTDVDVDTSLHTLTDPRLERSVHYVIGRDGKLFQLVDERDRAWHAGASYWGGITDLNSASIGIELDNTGREPFPEPQLQTLLALLADLKQRHKIPTANFIGHGDIAPRRKIDPSGFFPWKRLSELGFGLWCEPPDPLLAGTLDPAAALQAFGYDVSDLAGAIAAFRRHYSRPETGPELGDAERALLKCLIAQKPILPR